MAFYVLLRVFCEGYDLPDALTDDISVAEAYCKEHGAENVSITRFEHAGAKPEWDWLPPLALQELNRRREIEQDQILKIGRLVVAAAKPASTQATDHQGEDS